MAQNNLGLEWQALSKHTFFLKLDVDGLPANNLALISQAIESFYLSFPFLKIVSTEILYRQAVPNRLKDMTQGILIVAESK